MENISESEDLNVALLARAHQDPSRRGFAYTVPQLEDLGPALGAALNSQLATGEEPQQVVVLPRQRLLQRRSESRPWSPFPTWKHSPEQILVKTSTNLICGTIHDGQSLEITSTPINQMITTQLGTILLFSWFEWSWASDGKLETKTVYFNSVSDQIFRELQQGLSRKFGEAGRFKTVQNNQGIQQLENLPYKFRNLIPLRLLLPEEELQALVFHPGRWESRMVFLRRHIAPATALLLTDGQILVAEEELGVSERHYGMIARFMPRFALRQASLEEWGEGLLLRFSININGVDFEQRLKFELDAKPHLEQLLTLLGQYI
jgi:hypothetical protein